MNSLQRQTFVGISAIAVVAGVLAFAVGLADGAAVRAWQAFLVNLLFFLGIAQGGVVVSASFYLTRRDGAERDYTVSPKPLRGFFLSDFFCSGFCWQGAH